MVGAPAFLGERDAHFDVPVGGEFHGVGQQVLENLLQALGVALQESRQIAGELHLERQILGFRHVAEIAFDVVAQLVEGEFFDFHA